MSHQFVHLKDLRPMQKGVNVQFIVLDVYDPTRTKDGNEVRNISVADRTGRMTLALWNELGRQVHPGDICRVLNGMTTVFKQEMTLNVGKIGELQKTGDFMMLFSEKPNLSEVSPEMLAKVQEMNAPRLAKPPELHPAPRASKLQEAHAQRVAKPQDVHAQRIPKQQEAHATRPTGPPQPGRPRGPSIGSGWGK